MIVRSALQFAVMTAGWLGLAAATPAGAVEFAPSGKSFETLMTDGYRIVAAVSTPGLVIPLLLLGKDGRPDVFMCFQQFRDCGRLVDSPNNTPPGVVAPNVPQTSPR